MLIGRVARNVYRMDTDTLTTPPTKHIPVWTMADRLRKNDVSAARLLAMIEAEQADGWTDFRIVGHLIGYLAERAAITGNDAA